MMMAGLRPRFAARALRRGTRAGLASRSADTTDYVVVGAGSAGCVVASRLAEGGASVRLLEAGGDSNLRGPLSVLTRMPTALSIPMHFPRWNWAFETEAAAALDGRRVSCPRGRGLGGSSSINGMVYVRGHPLDYAAWVEAGCDGWDWPDVARYFKKMENWSGGDDGSGLRGTDGPLHVTEGADALGTGLFDAFLASGESAGYGITADYNGARQEGVGPMPATIFHDGPRAGERCSTAAAYLEPALAAHGGALTVETGALAARVAFDGARATGVEAADGRTFRAGEEVILCGGAIGTPHLLQRSGVGARSLCEGLGIESVADVPGVGGNLQDHLEFYPVWNPNRFGIRFDVSVFRNELLGALSLSGRRELGERGRRVQESWETSSMRRRNENFEEFLGYPKTSGRIPHRFYLQYAVDRGSLIPYLRPWRKAAIGAEWLATGRGLGATNHFEAGAFLRSRAGVEYPDVQVHFLPAGISYDGVTTADTPTGHSFQLHVGCNRSPSRGAVAATSADPAVPPSIDFDYMSSSADWEDYREALRLCRELVGHVALDGVAEVSPGPAVADDAAVDAYLREHLESAYHPCGTCAMGRDADGAAVTDAAGAVRGTRGLRVIDASLFPTIPNGNLNAPTIMVAEKLSDAVLGNGPPPPVPHAAANPRGWVDPHWEDRQRERPPAV